MQLKMGKVCYQRGYKKLSGNFEKGDHILIKKPNNTECARGLSSFSSNRN